MWCEKVKLACKVFRTEHAQIPGYALVKYVYQPLYLCDSVNSINIEKWNLNPETEVVEPVYYLLHFYWSIFRHMIMNTAILLAHQREEPGSRKGSC